MIPLLGMMYDNLVAPTLTVATIAGIVSAFWKLFTERQIKRVEGGIQKEISNLNSRLDKQKESFVHVFKAKFDLEIKVYQEIWAALFELRDATIQMAPRVEEISEDEQEEQRLQVLIKRHQEFGKAYNLALTNRVKYQPFYPEEISNRIDDFIGTCRKEGGRFKLSIQQRHPVLLEEKEKYINEMEVAYHAVSGLIRIRLEQISVVDEDGIPEAIRIR